MLKRTLLAVASVMALAVVPVASSSMAQTPGAVSDILKQLELTPEQQPKVDQIQAVAKGQIQGILSVDQLRQLKVLSEEGRADSEAFKSLNLTDEQKTRLNEVQMDVAQQLFAVLTPEQMQRLINELTARSKTP